MSGANKTTKRGLLCVIGIGLLILGCGGRRDSRPATAPVSGRVLFGGEPVAEALVVFYPTTPHAAAAHATTDDNGKYVLTSFHPSDGAVPGSYIVLITKQQAMNEMTPQESRAYYERTGASPPLPTYKDLLPKKYGNHESSGLSAEVSAEGENQFDFEL